MTTQVLDKGTIELLDVMPHDGNVDLAVIQAARVTHLEGTKGAEKDRSLINYLMRHEHTSPFEMVEFKFRIHAPLVVWWQWVRHRTFHFMNINSQSGRYTPFEEDDFYVPSGWRLQSRSNHQGSAGWLKDVESVGASEDSLFTRLLQTHYENSMNLYQQAIDTGIAKEQARLFLPGFAVYYSWIVKIDLHNLFHFLRLRMADDAQYEIQLYALAMYFDCIKPLAPMCCQAFEDHRINPNLSNYTIFELWRVRYGAGIRASSNDTG